MSKTDPQTLSRDDLALTAAFLIALAAALGALFIGEMLGQISKTELLRKAALEPIERILQRGVAQGLFKDQLSAVDVHYLISALSGFRVDHAATWHSLLQVDLLGENLRARHLQLLLDQLGALVCKEQG